MIRESHPAAKSLGLKWYPVEATGVFHEIMAEQMPAPRQAALVDPGISAVRHLSNQDIYGQLDFKGRSLDETKSRDVIIFGRRVSTIIHSFYNFGEAVFERSGTVSTT